MSIMGRIWLILWRKTTLLALLRCLSLMVLKKKGNCGISIIEKKTIIQIQTVAQLRVLSLGEIGGQKIACRDRIAIKFTAFDRRIPFVQKCDRQTESFQLIRT